MNAQQPQFLTNVSAVDLFCGAGGLTCGLQSSGIRVSAGYDIDPFCEFPFSHNNGSVFCKKDVSSVAAEELAGHYRPGEVRILVGCAPCQPFSTYSQRYQTIGTDRWRLLYSFGDKIQSLHPELVAMENVPSVRDHSVFRDFLRTLRREGYSVWADVIQMSDLGLPQKRKRMVVIASRIGVIEPKVHNGGGLPTVKDAIQHLPALSAGGVDSMDPLHRSAKLSRINIERIRASTPKGTWLDWPEELRAPCHSKESGAGYGAVYGRMDWHTPAPTLTTQFYNYGSGRFGHPEQDRAISLREGATLQGFPTWYKFYDRDFPGTTVVGRLIGNAVPVALGAWIGKVFAAHLADDRVVSRLDQARQPSHQKTQGVQSVYAAGSV